MTLSARHSSGKHERIFVPRNTALAETIDEPALRVVQRINQLQQESAQRAEPLIPQPMRVSDK